MNIHVQSITGTFFGGGFGFSHKGLKSTEEKLERQEKRDNEVAFFEKQKENLKNRKCATVEEIADKLDMLKSYDDQIAGIRAAYNNEQMWHMLDEAREMGEKIAEAAKEMEPKTPEERKEELLEEAMGTEDTGGMLDEMMEDAAQVQEELEETVQEEMQEQLAGELSEEMQEYLAEEVQGQLPGGLLEKTEEQYSGSLQENLEEQLKESLSEKLPYKPIDILI